MRFPTITFLHAIGVVLNYVTFIRYLGNIVTETRFVSQKPMLFFMCDWFANLLETWLGSNVSTATLPTALDI
jgi:hypothetical protein